MTRKAIKVKAQKEPKFSTRRFPICSVCGRTRGFVFWRKFGLCRICFRKLALEGKIPGVRKASW